MKGIIKEGETFIKKEKSWFRGDIEDTVLDAALIASAQREEHYEISSYGTARAYANQLGFKEARRTAAANPGRREGNRP